MLSRVLPTAFDLDMNEILALRLDPLLPLPYHQPQLKWLGVRRHELLDGPLLMRLHVHDLKPDTQQPLRQERSFLPQRARLDGEELVVGSTLSEHLLEQRVEPPVFNVDGSFANHLVRHSTLLHNCHRQHRVHRELAIHRDTFPIVRRQRVLPDIVDVLDVVGSAARVGIRAVPHEDVAVTGLSSPTGQEGVGVEYVAPADEFLTLGQAGFQFLEWVGTFWPDLLPVLGRNHGQLELQKTDGHGLAIFPGAKHRHRRVGQLIGRKVHL
mmetsp:Transcript_49520/g.130514  ORF Transcript_49520/g.130514 Transcript_49520/m.130514 type:complete len:268 (-) Transcript_49520:1142-1945(-)